LKIVILGAGPAGLYCALLVKKANPAHDITIIERNPPDVTYGWGVVFSDRTLASFQRADYKTYEQIRDHFVIWDAIDVCYRDETIRCGGHVIASISRKLLLNILQRRCAELGVTLRFNCEISALSELPEYDLLIAADGINSLIRRSYESVFKPVIKPGKAPYIWLGTDKVLDAFTFIFRENEHGLFQVHAYPFSGTASTFIVECDEETWLKAGLDKASEAESLAYCERLFAADLNGAKLLSNNSKWISFPMLKTQNWQHQRMVLLGDAAHTAHFSIGSGTKLAMEDAIALAGALEQHSDDLATALNEYELERKPVVEVFQRAASESQLYFETNKRSLGLDPMPFAVHLLTRSGRITYDDLRRRDVHFGDAVDRWYMQKAAASLQSSPEMPRSPILVAPPPMYTPLKLRDLTIPNRVILSPRPMQAAQNGAPTDAYAAQLCHAALAGAGMVMSLPVAVSAEGRITPECAGMYEGEHVAVWSRMAAFMHAHSAAKLAMQLNHAGRRGSTRPRAQGLDRPLREGNWPLLSASPLPYTSYSHVPAAMERADMERVRDDFVRAASMAQEVGVDLLQLHFGHGYLLASFLSSLTNRREDEYGGDLERRMRFPLEVFDAVRAVWPQEKPLSVALSVTDGVKGGFAVEDAVTVARCLKEHGCDLLEVLAGQTTPESELTYGRGYLTALSDQVRNEAGIATIVGGYLTTSDEVDTIVAAGRADLCVMEAPQLNIEASTLFQFSDNDPALEAEIVRRG
jgi:anthraniloyl-CoA monooxygenase